MKDELMPPAPNGYNWEVNLDGNYVELSILSESTGMKIASVSEEVFYSQTTPFARIVRKLAFKLLSRFNNARELQAALNIRVTIS